jgi:hypothetical protein
LGHSGFKMGNRMTGLSLPDIQCSAKILARWVEDAVERFLKIYKYIKIKNREIQAVRWICWKESLMYVKSDGSTTFNA